MAIRSKTNYFHKYENIEPMFDRRTGQFFGDVFASRVGLDGRMHLKLSSLRADTEEDQVFLDSLQDRSVPVSEEDDVF